MKTATHTREEKNIFLQGVCGKGKSSEDTYDSTYQRTKKLNLARSVGQYFPQIQVYIMKKSHLAAKSAVQDLLREVI